MAKAESPHMDRGTHSYASVTSHNADVNEHTSLLPSISGSTYHDGTISPEEVFIDEDLEGPEIDPNDFDILLSRSESIATGLGIEVESQETAMLRGPRRYSVVRSGSRAPSYASDRRKSLASTIGSNRQVIDEGEEETDERTKPKSPFLAGVSVGRFWLIFGGILTAYFVACFDSTIMVSSHPVITSYFESSNSASWLSTSFLLMSTAFQPLFGRLSDTIGRKPPYVFCMSIFLISTIWCGLAQSMTSFIVARAVCGFGAGGVITLGSIITSDLVPIEIRGVYQSYINIIFGCGGSLGAALGGAIADSLGWRWEFGVQVPAIVVSLGIATLTMPRKLGLGKGIEKKGLWEAMKLFDFKGSLLLTTSITVLILGLNLGGNVFRWSHPLVISSLVIFCICFPLFIFVESRVDLPIMPLKILRYNPRAGLIISNFLGTIIMNAVTFNIPLYFQAVLLESATSSGLRLIVPVICASAAGTATGFLITWTRRLKWLLVWGAIFLCLGTAGLSMMPMGLPHWAYILFIIPSNIGQGFLFPATFMSVLAVSSQAEQAVVTSTLILWRSMGSVLGVAISSLVLQNALLIFLEQKVIGPDKKDVIQQVRKSVQAIQGLEPMYREQVIDAYAASLRATFFTAAVLSVVTLVTTVPLKLPRLGQRK